VSALLRIDRLVKHYGSRRALDGISFSIDAGEIVGLLGPNGAGKSTTISVIATLLPADQGEVEVAGHALRGAAREARRAIGLVPQQTAVYPTLTARENLRFFGLMQGIAPRDVAAASARALELVALDGRADEPVLRFSVGMRRRLNLACGVLHTPRLLLLDEPTVGVDPQSRERIFDAIEGLARHGAAVLYSTHHMEEAERLCDRVVLLDQGRVVASGTPQALIARAGMAVRLRLRAARPLPSGWLDDLPGAKLVSTTGRDATVELADTTTVPAAILCATRACGSVVELALEQPNLADVFFRLTGRALRDDDTDAGIAREPAG
jgi:ABC-2 type transport system ATP-binding protein